MSHPTTIAPRRRLLAAVAIAILGMGLVAPVARVSAAASLVPVVSGLSEPVFVTNAHDGSDRLFVVEQTGRIRVIKAGALLPTPYLDVRTLISVGGERGLLGLAFHPDFATNHKFYVSFTRRDGNLVVYEFRASTTNPDVALRSTARHVITVPHPGAANHNGGMIAFGPDGYLYLGTGDGGGAGDTGNHAQDKDSLLGKILRIGINSTTGRLHYHIPSDNPYVGRSGLDEIWSYGLRNPWRFSFDRVKGDIWIGDVGQNRYEEIDHRAAGSKTTPNGRGVNYGWHVMEGSHCYVPTSCSTYGKALPTTGYRHALGRCSITGGYAYRGSASPGLAGRYVFADYCTGEVWVVSLAAVAGTIPGRILDTNLMISSFGEDEQGELYIVDHGGGIYRLTAS